MRILQLTTRSSAFAVDLWLLNQALGANSLQLTFHCYIGACPSFNSSAVANVNLNPYETKFIGDVVGSLFSTHEAAGAIEVRWVQSYSTPLIAVSSRTFSIDPSTGGTYGTGLTSSWRTVQRAVFVGVAGDGGDRGAGFRTNVGFYRYYDLPNATSATLTLYSRDGAVLGRPVTVSFASGTQVNDIFRAAGAGSMTMRDATLLVEVSDPVFAYATVIDNKTGDATYVDPVEADPTAKKTYIGGQISTNRPGVGVGGIPITVTQNWQTLVIHSNSDGGYYAYPLAFGSAIITFSPGDGCPDMNLTVSIPVEGLILSPQLCP